MLVKMDEMLVMLLDNQKEYSQYIEKQVHMMLVLRSKQEIVLLLYVYYEL